MTLIRTLFFLSATLFFIGCATEQELRDKRIAENQPTFLKLSNEEQSRSRIGQVAIGDSTTAVWFAWGKPDKKFSTTNKDGSTENWEYHKEDSKTVYELVPDRPHERYTVPYGCQVPQPGWHYEPRTVYVPIIEKFVQFFNGRATQINIYE